MDMELGKVVKQIRSPEKLTVQAPMWRDILFNLIPMLILGYLELGLLSGAGLSNEAALALSILAVIAFTALCVAVARGWKRRFAEIVLNVHENGLSGTAAGSAFRSKSFAFPWGELKSASGKKNRLTLLTASGSYTLFADNAAELAEELEQRKAEGTGSGK